MGQINSKVEPAQQMDKLDSRDNWQYPSASETGFTEIELPALPGSATAVERLHTRDFGVHVIGAIERSFKRQGYMKSGPQQSPSATFRHYLGCARGSQLMGSDALQRMETLAQDFEREPEQEEFFKQVLRPSLLALAPRRR